MRILFTLLVGILLGPLSVSASDVEVDDFDNIRQYTLRNTGGMIVKITNYGATITSLSVPDRDGHLADIVLGYDSVEQYINAVDKPYFGAIVGRYGNRIAKGTFALDGSEYNLATNNGENHLHGGMIGFDKVVWDATPRSGDSWIGVELSYRAKDGEEGYPGNLDVRVTYRLFEENTMEIEYHATTDKPTPVNLTQHSYFNLKGEGEGTVLDHHLLLNATRFTPVDETLIPNGELRSVADTPFDFTTAKPIGRDIGKDDQQLSFGLGYDHNFVLEGSKGEMRLAAQVYDPTSGRVMEIHTVEPGIQFYSGNFLDGRLKGKSGNRYVHRGGFCLETQHFPDSPNQKNFPSTVLRPGENSHTKTIYFFSTSEGPPQ